MNGFFNSPRNQRRLFIVSGLVLAAGIAASSSRSSSSRQRRNAFTDTISNKPAKLYHPEKNVPVSKAEISVARKFIQTAVARQNLNAAYDIVHTDLKGRLTPQPVEHGQHPRDLLPRRENAQTAAFQADYSYQTSALLEVDLRREAGLGPAAAPPLLRRPQARRRQADRPLARELLAAALAAAGARSGSLSRAARGRAGS